jgi:hypothetical protein
VLNIQHTGEKGKLVSIGYISATGKIQLDLTKMKSYMHNNRTEIYFRLSQSQCQGTSISNSGIPHALEVSYLTFIFLIVDVLTTAKNTDTLAVQQTCCRTDDFNTINKVSYAEF